MSTPESQKFEKYRDDWWDPEGRLFSLHRINPLRFEYFAGKVDTLVGKRVLDVGCGGGILSESFAKAGAILTSIDLSPVAIEAAKEHAKKGGLAIDYRVVSIGAFKAESPAPFDIVVCAEVLEHVDDVGAFLKDALSLLKPGGLFFFGTINKTMKARFLALFMAEDVLKMVPKGTHDYKRLIRPSMLMQVMRENNVEMMELKGLTYEITSMDFALSGDTSVNYLGFGKKSA